MDAQIIHVTHHAAARWRERSGFRDCDNEFIIEIVKQSRQIKKTENLPYPIIRRANSIYTVYDNILFILESVSLIEYRLVTIICDPPPKDNLDYLKFEQLTRPVSYETLFPEGFSPSSATEKRKLLLRKKQEIELSFKLVTKLEKHLLLNQLKFIEKSLAENHDWWILEKQKRGSNAKSC